MKSHAEVRATFTQEQAEHLMLAAECVASRFQEPAFILLAGEMLRYAGFEMQEDAERRANYLCQRLYNKTCEDWSDWGRAWFRGLRREQRSGSYSSKPSRPKISKHLRFSVLSRDGHRCVYCGMSSSDGSLVMDHVVPFSKGGSTCLSNLVAACTNCNMGKGSREITDSPEDAF